MSANEPDPAAPADAAASAVAPADTTAADAPAKTSHDRRNRVIAGLITLVVLVIVFAGILPKFGNYSEAWDAIKDMSTAQLAVLIGAVALSIIVYVFPFQVSLPGLKYGPAFMIRQTSFTISNAVPAGGAVGLGVQYAMLAQAGFAGAAATAAIGITSVFNLMVTLALPVLGVIALLFVEKPQASEILGALGGLVAVIAMVVAFGAVLRSETTARRIGDWADGVIGKVMARFHKDKPADIADQLVAFRTSTVDVVRARWALLTVSNFAQQFTQFGVLLVCLRITEAGKAVEVPIAAAFAAFALARLAGFIPLTPGGLGTVDAGLTGLLVAFGATKTDALAATLLWRAASWVPQVIIGIITFLIWRARSGRMKAALAEKEAAESSGPVGSTGATDSPGSPLPA